MSHTNWFVLSPAIMDGITGPFVDLLCQELGVQPFQNLADLKQSLQSAPSTRHLYPADSPIQAAEVSSWVSLSIKIYSKIESLNGTLAIMDQILTRQPFLCRTTSLSLADYAMYLTIQSVRNDTAINDKVSSARSVLRWLDTVQHGAKSSKTQPLNRAATVHVFYDFRASSTASATTATPVATEATTKPATSEQTKSTGSEKAVEPAKEKKEKKSPAAESKAAENANTAAAAVSEDVLDPSQLDIRVGRVVRCWNHPDSEKLLCEEIDVGEAAPRTIASGLRAFYAAEQVEGQLVIVLANLKERAMAGFKSQGMVLCASNSDHTDVKLLIPPKQAVAGDRVTFPGFAGEPLTANQVAKKKVLEKLAPKLRTNEAGVAMWNDSPFTIGGETVTAAISNGTVS